MGCQWNGAGITNLVEGQDNYLEVDIPMMHRELGRAFFLRI
jgi:hypothetical protein